MGIIVVFELGSLELELSKGRSGRTGFVGSASVGVASFEVGAVVPGPGPSVDTPSAVAVEGLEELVLVLPVLVSDDTRLFPVGEKHCTKRRYGKMEFFVML